MVATSRLEIEVVTQPSDLDWPLVQFLIDGRPLLANTKFADWLGFDPGDMLSDNLPLLPDAPWRRTAVYRCSCGLAGCGVVAPLIVVRADGNVLWTDFRDYTGVFAGPTVDEDPDDGRELGLQDLTFDRVQYEAEVLRATRDRSWETDRRATARLVQQRLERDRPKFAEVGFRLDWVFPEQAIEDAVMISLTKDGRQHLLSVAFGDGTPETCAERVTDALWSVSPTDWRQEFAGARRF